MTLLGLPLAQLGLLFGGAATLVTLLYVLKLRRRRVTVPFARLWDRVQRETESTSLFRRLKRLLSLLIQLLFLLLLAAALGDPRLGSQVLEGRNIILLLDASASMQAVEADLTAAPGQEGGGRSMSPGETAQVTRMDQAVHRARRLVRSMGGDDHMMIVRMAGQATPLSPFTSDGKVLLRALDGAQAGDTPASLTRALQ